MLYLLDANVLMDAARDYYALDRVPEFWAWLAHLGEQDVATVPPEIYDELTRKGDLLAEWARRPETKSALLLDEEPDRTLVTRAVNDGYAPDLTDEELEALGRDPFLVAYALAAPADRCVVTSENSKPRRIRHNRHLPDVCSDLGVECWGPFRFFRELDFRTDWARA